MIDVRDYSQLGCSAHLEVCNGQIKRAWSTIHTLEEVGSPIATAWALFLRSAVYFADPETGQPALSELEPFLTSSGTSTSIASMCCFYCARAGLLAFDRERSIRWVELQTRLTNQVDDATSKLWLDFTNAWLNFAIGRHDDESNLQSLEERAAHFGERPLVIEAAALRALLLLMNRDREEAIKVARRASRMAAVEDLPQPQYLANLVLARVRRFFGKPHLAARILTALLKVAPAPWRPWLEWELVLSGGSERREAESTKALRQMIEAARSGDRIAYQRAKAETGQRVRGLSQLTNDLEVLSTLIDPSCVPDPSCEAWLSGRSDEAPNGIQLLSGDRVLTAYAQSEPTRRVLEAGLGFSRATQLKQERTKERTDSALAALILSGPNGLREEKLFRSLYGFDYQEELHRGVRDVLFHRVRARLKAHGRLERHQGQVSAILQCSLAVPDPRTAVSSQQSILTFLAEQGSVSAKDVSTALGLPLRTAQEALRQLAEDGACIVVKSGRRFDYRIEDTTFSNPTQELRPPIDPYGN